MTTDSDSHTGHERHNIPVTTLKTKNMNRRQYIGAHGLFFQRIGLSMASTVFSTQHALLSTSQVIRRIAEHIRGLADRSSFAQVSKGLYGPATQVLYRRISIDSTAAAGGLGSCCDDFPGLCVATRKRRVALLKTLRRKGHLSKAVLILNITSASFEDIGRNLAACPSIIALGLRLNCPRVFQDTGPRARLPLPVITSTVKRLKVFYHGHLHLINDAFLNFFSGATSLRALSLDTTLETAQFILACFSERRITSLRLSGSELGATGFILSPAYADLIRHVPHLASLRMDKLIDHRVEDILFPPLLQELVIDHTEFGVVERIFELLATDPSWLPRLIRLVHFRSIGSTDLMHNREDAWNIRLKRFHANCRRAYLMRARGVFWQGDAFECKRTIAKYDEFYYFYKAKMDAFYSTHGHHIQ